MVSTAVTLCGERIANPIIPASGTFGYGYEFADIYDTANDPLCRIVRKEARKRGIRSLRVLYSREEPAALPLGEPAPAEAGRRPTLGTASYVPPIMGQMLAGFVIRELAVPRGRS